MALSNSAAFGGCRTPPPSWFPPCVLLCVPLGHVSLPCVGRPCARLLCCLRSSHFGLFHFLLARLLLLVCGAGGAACRSLHPLVAVGLSDLQLGMGYRCVCTTGTVQIKEGVQSKSRRKKLLNDMS